MRNIFTYKNEKVMCLFDEAFIYCELTKETVSFQNQQQV
jgi:hypothetical protein